MDRPERWITGLVVVVALVALVAFARGGAERGNPDPSPAALIQHVVG